MYYEINAGYDIFCVNYGHLNTFENRLICGWIG